MREQLGNGQLFKSLGMDSSFDYFIGFDMDETLIDNRNNENNRWITHLEELIEYLAIEKKAIFSLLTGSNFENLLKKFSKFNVRLMPHFIASGFGTELLYFDEKTNQFIDDLCWSNHSLQGLYTKDKIKRILYSLKQHHIHLVPETRGFNPYKDSYYYYSTNPREDHDVIRIIKTISKNFHVHVIISQCNPNAGDPEDAYDIDFIPQKAGKENVARYLIKKFNIPHENTLAFGDSQNDLQLLKFVAHGFAVSNCTAGLKYYQLPLCQYDHAHGIYQQLIEFFQL